MQDRYERGEIVLQDAGVEVVHANLPGAEPLDPLPDRLDVALVVLVVGLVLEPPGLLGLQLRADPLALLLDLDLPAGVLERVDELVDGDGPLGRPRVRLPQLHLRDVQRIVVVEERVVHLRHLDRGLAALPGRIGLQPQYPPGHEHQLAGHDHVEAVAGDLGLVEPDELREVHLPGVDAVLQHQAEHRPYRFVHRVLEPLPAVRAGEDLHVPSDPPEGLAVVGQRPVEQQVLLQILHARRVPIHLNPAPPASRPAPRTWRPPRDPVEL